MLPKGKKTGRPVEGTTAYPGRVRGTVRILRIAKDVQKVRRGDVLVAAMTFPHFIAAMERAAAFVTDEGGILCHAAIVSREMKKPCVIGTKVATHVLRDGDRVFVDATKGTIKKV
jgi:pyruvate,water dikinase